MVASGHRPVSTFAFDSKTQKCGSPRHKRLLDQQSFGVTRLAQTGDWPIMLPGAE
jgi:hypothetical protein